MPNRLERLRSWYEAHGKGDVDFDWLLRVAEAAEHLRRGPIGKSTAWQGVVSVSEQRFEALRAVLDEEDKG